MDVVIIGAGGHGRDCHQLIDDLHADGSGCDLHLIGYVDDDPALRGAEVQGLPVLGGLEWLAGRGVAGVMGIGYPRPRYAAQQRATALGITHWPTLVHPRAYVASRAVLGRGVHVAPHVTIGANAHLQDWAVVQIASIIGHDSIIGEHAFTGANVTICGAVRIGAGAQVGSSATVGPRGDVGDWAEIGMGAVVTHPIPPNVRALGVPARVVAALKASA